jgi:5'-3' exoribonuclease 2
LKSPGGYDVFLKFYYVFIWLTLPLYLDGVAPRAKQNQQRSRRFRSAQEAKEKEEEKEEFRKLLKKGNKFDEGVEHAVIKVWDSNVITPGTPFMNILAMAIRYWVAWKLNKDPGWAKLKVIISDAFVPGEGEHKIMEFIRSQRSSPEYDPNTRHVIYGLDADLIMLGLGTHEPYFRVLREDVFFQDAKPGHCRLCGQAGHKASQCTGEAKKKKGEFDEKADLDNPKPFIWLHVSILREYLEIEMQVPNQPFPFDLERALDDWVFMCFFVGNDFLPHLPSLDIREQGIDTLIKIWRDNLHLMGGYLTKDGQVNLERAQIILEGLARQENDIFRRRRAAAERQDINAQRRKIEEQNRNGNSQNSGRKRRASPDYNSADLMLSVPSKDEISPKFNQQLAGQDMAANRTAIHKANDANKSAAAALKAQLMKSKSDSHLAGVTGPPTKDISGNYAMNDTPPSALAKRKAELMEDNASTPGQSTPGTPGSTKVDDGEVVDTVRLWEEGYADRYYEQKFDVDPKDIEFRHKVARAYVEGLCWVLLYYFQGCPSWNWYYPYHYAPFAADFVDLGKMDIKFEKGKPFKPYEQLMGVLPAASNHAIPEVFRNLMTDPDSDIIDFYPEEFPIDLNGKKFAWQGVAILPWIDEKRLLAAMGTRYHSLTEEENRLNEVGRDALLISGQHPLSADLMSNFYSKRQGSPKYTLNVGASEGLAGKVEKNEDYTPMRALIPPLDEIGLDEVDVDESIR